MGVQRSGDAAGVGAISHRPLFQDSSTTQPLSLSGGAAEGGLLATFDAIFRQTMAPAPLATPPPATPPPAPSFRNAGSSGAPTADPLDAPESSAAEDDEDHDRPTNENAAAAVAPPPVSGGDTASEVTATAASGEAESASEQEASPDPVAKAAEESEDPTANQGADAPPVNELSPPTAAEVDGVDASQVAAVQPQEVTGAEQPALEVHQERTQETAAVEIAAPAAAKQTEVEAKATAAVQPTVEPATETGDPGGSRATEESGDPVVAEGVDSTNPDELPLSDTATTEEAGPAEDRGRNRRGRDPNRQGERNGELANHSGGGERRVAEATSADTALDRLVAQMQPVESAAEAPVMSPMASSSATASGAAAIAAPPATTAPVAAKVERSDATNATADRPGLEGAEPRRSVGEVKGEAGDRSAQQTSNADRVRLVQRVARAFQRLGPTGGRVQVMLHPAALGSVRLDLRIDGNRMDARMTAESEAARSVLREHLPELRQKLADSGLVVERIDVELDGRTSGEGEHRSQSGSQNGEESGWRRTPQPTPPSRQSSPTNPAPSPRSLPPTARGSRPELDLMA